MIQLGNAARDSAIIEALEGVLMYVGGGCVSVECGRKMHRNGTFIILLFRQIIMGSVKLIRLWAARGYYDSGAFNETRCAGKKKLKARWCSVSCSAACWFKNGTHCGT